jgi:hypothetical protein
MKHGLARFALCLYRLYLRSAHQPGAQNTSQNIKRRSSQGHSSVSSIIVLCQTVYKMRKCGSTIPRLPHHLAIERAGDELRSRQCRLARGSRDRGCGWRSWTGDQEGETDVMVDFLMLVLII